MAGWSQSAWKVVEKSSECPRVIGSDGGASSEFRHDKSRRELIAVRCCPAVCGSLMRFLVILSVFLAPLSPVPQLWSHIVSSSVRAALSLRLLSSRLASGERNRTFSYSVPCCLHLLLLLLPRSGISMSPVSPSASCQPLLELVDILQIKSAPGMPATTRGPVGSLEGLSPSLRGPLENEEDEYVCAKNAGEKQGCKIRWISTARWTQPEM